MTKNSLKAKPVLPKMLSSMVCARRSNGSSWTLPSIFSVIKGTSFFLFGPISALMIFGLLMSLICGTLASAKKKWLPFASGYLEYKKVWLPMPWNFIWVIDPGKSRSGPLCNACFGILIAMMTCFLLSVECECLSNSCSHEAENYFNGCFQLSKSLAVRALWQMEAWLNFERIVIVRNWRRIILAPRCLNQVMQ